MLIENNKSKSNTNLNVIRNKWNAISEEFNKQIEKSCFTGVAIIWIFMVIADYKLMNEIVYSLICFVIPLLISFSINLYELFNNYIIFSKAKFKIKKGESLNNIDLNPSKLGLIISSIYFAFVFLGYIFIGLYAWFNIFNYES